MAEFKSTWLYAASMTGGSLTAVQLLVHPADVAAWQDVHVDEDLLYAQGRIEIEAHIGVTEVEHEQLLDLLAAVAHRVGVDEEVGCRC